METKYYKNEEEKAFAKSNAEGTFIKPFGKEEYKATGDALKFWYEITQGSVEVSEEEYNKG